MGILDNYFGFDNEEATKISDSNSAFDARDKILQEYNSVINSQSYRDGSHGWTEENKKRYRDYVRDTVANLGEFGNQITQQNIEEANYEDARRREQLANDTWEALKSGTGVDWTGDEAWNAAINTPANMVGAALTDLGKNAYEYNVNVPKTMLALGAQTIGSVADDDKDGWWHQQARNLADNVLNARENAQNIMGASEFTLDSMADTARASANAVSNLAALFGSVPNVVGGKVIGAAASGLGNITGATRFFEKMYGLADSAALAEKGIAWSTAEALATKGREMMINASRLNAVSGLDYAKGLLGLASGKLASAAPTWATMSLPELYSDYLTYDEMGNVVLPEDKRILSIGLAAIPHAIIENMDLNPQKFGEAAEKMAFEKSAWNWFKSAIGEGNEEVFQDWIQAIEKEYGQKDPVTGKVNGWTDAIGKVAYDLSTNKDNILGEQLQEWLAGAVGGAVMGAADKGFGYSKKYLQMHESYRNRLNAIAQGLDNEAKAMESMGIADFSALRSAQKEVNAIGDRIKELDDKINSNKYKSEDERKTDIMNKATLEAEADYLSANLANAAEAAANDYQSGLTILEQMQSDYKNQVEQQKQNAQSVIDSMAQTPYGYAQNMQEAQAASEALNNPQTMEYAAQSGNFNTEQYQPQIDEAIKTFKTDNQIDREWEAAHPDEAANIKAEVKQRRNAYEAEKKKAIDEELAKPAVTPRTQSELDEAFDEYDKSSFEGNFNDYLRAKDQEDAAMQKEAEAEAEKQQKNGMTFEEWEKNYPAPKGFKWTRNEQNSWTLEKVKESEAQKSEPSEAMKSESDNMSEEDRQMLKDIDEDNTQIDEELKEQEAKLARSAEHSYDYEQAKGQIEYLKNQKGKNNKQKQEILDKVKAFKAPERKGKSTKVGSKTVYETKKDAMVAAADMLEQGKKSGKIASDAKIKDTYTISKTKFGYVVKDKVFRTKTIDGKNTVDKDKAQKKIAEVNKNLTKKKGKGGKKIRVELVEDQSQLSDEDLPFSIKTNPFTGIYEKSKTVAEGSTDTNGDEIVVRIVRNNIESEQRLDEVLAHEILHAGIRFVLNKSQRSYLLQQVDRLIKSDKAFAAEVMPTISDYWTAGRNVQLEEVLARLAEKVDAYEDSGIRKIWNKIVGIIYKGLRKLGLTTNLHKSELTNIIKGLRNDLSQTGDLFNYTKGMMGSKASAKAMFRADNMQKALTKLSKGKELFTYDINDGKPLASLRTWDEGGRAALVDFLKKAYKADEISSEDAKAMISEMDSIAKACKLMKEEFPQFSQWSDTGVTYDEQGKPHFTVVRKNGDYVMNIDFSTVCKKRRPLNNVLNEMVKRGMLNEHGTLEAEDFASIQKIVKEKGFEVACALCFVDSRRYNIGQQAKNICMKWNKMLDLYNNDRTSFDGILNGKLKIDYENNKIIPNTSKKKADNDEESSGGMKHEKIAGNAIKNNEKYRFQLTEDWLVSSGSKEMIGGHDYLAKNYPAIFQIVHNYSAGQPKESHSDVVWNNDIIKSFAALNNSDATVFDAAKAFAIGGVRLQSFSDYVPTMFFDYCQCISELAAKGLPAHCYTKEEAFVRLFGQCGIKTNMSLVYSNEGVIEISKAEYDRILNDKNKGEAYIATLKGKYYKYDFADETFDPKKAIELRKDPRFKYNCGTIAVAISNLHAEVLLADPNIDMVIPYHASGMKKEIAKVKGIDKYKDYTNFQNHGDLTRPKNDGSYVAWNNKESRKAFEDAYFEKHGKKFEDYDFYDKLNNEKYEGTTYHNPRAVAKDYLKWCADNGLSPKYNMFQNNDNYYKLLVDFRVYDDEGNYQPQQAVKIKLTDDYQDVLRKSLTVDQKTASKFNNEIEDMLKKCQSALRSNKLRRESNYTSDSIFKNLLAGKKLSTGMAMAGMDKVKGINSKVVKNSKKLGYAKVKPMGLSKKERDKITKAKSKKNSVMFSLKSTVAERLREDLGMAIPDNSELRERYRDGSTKNYPEQLKMYDYITADGENIADIDSLLESRQSSPESQYTLNKMAKQFAAAFPGKVGRKLAENCQILRRSLQKDSISKKKLNTVTIDDILKSPVQDIFAYGNYAETEDEQKYEDYVRSSRDYAEEQKAVAEEGRQIHDKNLHKYQSLDSLMNDVEAGHVRFSLKTADPFYSNTLDAITKGMKKLPAKTKAATWLKQIQPYIHPEEDKWMGLSQWIKEHKPSDSITIDEILNYVKSNVVKMEEVNYSEDNIDNSADYEYAVRDKLYDSIIERLEPEIQDIKNYANNKNNDLTDEDRELLLGVKFDYDVDYNVLDDGFEPIRSFNVVAYPKFKETDESKINRLNFLLADFYNETSFGEEYDPDVDYEDYYGERLTDIFTNIATNNDSPEELYDNAVSDFEDSEERNSLPREINETRLEYTTKGLEDKREIAFVFPNVESYEGELPKIHFNDEYTQGKAVMWTRFGTATDKDGKKVLFVDEIQSQRHQDAIGKGYKKNVPPEVVKEYDDVRNRWIADRQRLFDIISKSNKSFSQLGAIGVDPWDSIDDMIEGKMPMSPALEEVLGKENVEAHLALAKDNISKALAADNGGSIPDAPLRENWYKTALKRMIRYAAENGFDKIAITTGKQQADRYRLSNYVDTLTIYAYSGNDYGALGQKNGEDVFDKTFDNEKDLREFVGNSFMNKALAQMKETSKQEAVFTGDNLTVGGDGMIHFYDNVVPSWLKKYCKQWGAKVTDEDTEGWSITDKDAKSVHVVDINDAMKESVLTKGQPMFSLKSTESDQKYLDAVNSGDMETAQRILDEAAKKAGYNIKAFHGTNSKFNEFRPNKAAGWGKGIYFASDRADAKNYGKNIVEGYISMQNPYNPSSAEANDILDAKAPQTETYKKAAKRLGYDEADYIDVMSELSENDVETYRKIIEESGFDGIKAYQSNDINGWEYVAFNPNQIKSADPITYDNAGNVIPLSKRFDRSKKDIRFSLKSVDKDYLKAIKDFGNTEELKTIFNNAKKNNTLGKAPNGEQSNLEPAQWLIVRTKQFKDWFGDWEKGIGSKVVDENSEPLVVYHLNAKGNNSFTEFKPTTIEGINPDGSLKMSHEKGVMFFSGDMAYQHYNPNTRAFFINIKNPLWTNNQSEIEVAHHNFSKLTQKAFANGNDGLIYADKNDLRKGTSGWGDDYSQFCTFNPEQIKSADPVTKDDNDNVIPLSERFNPKKKDIRYSLKGNNTPKKSLQQQYHDQLADAAKRIAERQAKVLSDSKKGIKARAADYLDRAEYNWADRRLYLRKWQENIEEALKGSPLMASLFDGDNLKDDVDVSALWDTIDGRIQTNRDEFTKNYWNKFYDMATDNKVSYDDLNRYLFARHAEERDAYIASINPDFANGGHGSGWDDSWGTPDSEKKRLEKKYGYQLMRDIGVAYDEMTQALVDKQLEYHLISKTTAEMLKNRYKHYVPLKRFDDAERHGYANNPAEMNIGQKINARAYGRESEPEHMLTFAKANIDTVFRRGERNMVKLAMLNLALRLNDANIQVDRQLVKRTLDRNGDVTYVADRSEEAKEQTIYITKGDATYSVTFHNKELYNAFISDDMTSGLLQSIVHGLRGITGIMGSNATSRNIEFGLVNLTKDQQQALAENLVYRGNGKTWYDFATSAIKNIPAAAKTFLKHSILKSDMAKQYGVKVQPDADTRMFEEFLKYGGTTGYIDIYRLTDDARKLEQQMDEKTMTFLQRWNKWKNEGRLTEKAKAQAEEWIAKVMAPLEFVNDLFEQTTRFSNYRAARQAGLSPLKAAELSKNLTLNFNRHGVLWTSKFNWAYMFSNASLQGTNKTLRMYQKAFSKKATPSEKKAARYILTLSLGAGIMSQILARAMSGDDDKDKLKYYDKLDASIKDNNIVIMLGGSSYIKIPLFVGAAFPYMMGRNATALMDGTQSIGESTTNIMQNMIDYFSPLGTAADNKEGHGSIVKSIMPTALRPFLDVSYNSNFAGSRIYAASYNSTKPAHTRAFNKTPEFYVGLSRLLNRMTGGNNVEKGYMDIPPEAIQHVVESYLGGTGKFFGRGYDTFARIISGETPDLGNVPFVRRFADNVGDAYVYDEFKQNEALYSTLTAAKESEDEEVLNKYPYYRKYLRKMKELKHRINSAKDSERLDRIKEANAALREIKNK